MLEPKSLICFVLFLESLSGLKIVMEFFASNENEALNWSKQFFEEIAIPQDYILGNISRNSKILYYWTPCSPNVFEPE